jgi:raffinose/stachyose/melibiose transport system permease protein
MEKPVHLKASFLNNRKFLPYLLISPAMVLYGFFVLYPIVQNLWFSFFHWTSFTNKTFNGLENYLTLTSDKVFWAALFHNLIWAGLTLAFPLLIGLILSSLLFRSKYRVFFSSIYYLPTTVPLVVSGIMWGWIYNPLFGLLNFTLENMGLQVFKRNWLAEPNIALYALNVLGAWTFFGFCTIIFINALQNIDVSIYEAAKIDGASNVQSFFHITIPTLKNTIAFLSIYSIIGAMKFFDIIYITTDGGPGYSTEILGTYIFKLVFRQQKVGLGSAVAVILFIIVSIMSLLILRRRNNE